MAEAVGAPAASDAGTVVDATGATGTAAVASAHPDPATGATLASLRARGAQALDPVRFAFIEAFARRAASHAGEAGRLLDHRLAALLADHETRFEAARAAPVAARGATPAPSAGPLAELLRHIAQHAAPQADPDAPTGSSPAGRDAAAPPAELRALRHFRGTWARLSADLRLAQSRAKAPENAGPLNSQALALRSLTLMREVSPACLNGFMSYLDALLWLDQLQQSGGGASLPRDAPRVEAEKPRKPAARKKAG